MSTFRGPTDSPLWFWAFWQMRGMLMKWCDELLNAKTHGRAFFFLSLICSVDSGLHKPRTKTPLCPCELWNFREVTWAQFLHLWNLRTTFSARGTYCKGSDMKEGQCCLAQCPASKGYPISVRLILGFPLGFFFFFHLTLVFFLI